MKCAGRNQHGTDNTKRKGGHLAKRLTALFLCFSLLFAEDLTVFADSTAEEDLEIEESADSWRYSDGQVIDSPNTDSLNGLSTLTSTYSSWKASYGTSYYGITSGSSVTKVKVSGVMRVGIDVSKWQGSIDWAKVAAAGIDYAIIRCGYGSNSTSQDDAYFLQNVEGALENGIEIGIYLYSYATSTTQAASEAKHVLRLLDEANLTPGDLELPVFLDMEDSTQGGIGVKALGNVAETFCDAIADEGYSVGIYASLSWWNNKLTDSRFSSSGWFKWVARHPTSSSVTTCGESDADMWQFSSHGTVSGISGNVDMNFDYRGSGAYTSNTPTLSSLKLSSSQTSVALTWSTVTGADGYRIFRSTDGASYERIAQVEGGSTKSYTDTVELNKTYKYMLKAYWVAEDGTISVGDAGNAKSVDTTLEAPVISSSMLTPSGYCKITWAQTAAAAGYEVYRSTDGGSYELVKTRTDAATVSFVDTTIVSGKVYRYKVRAYAPSGTGTAYSKYSPVVKFSTTPSKVGVTLSRTTSGTIKLTWSKHTEATGYEIYRSTDGGSYKLVKTITSRTTLKWTDTTVKSGRVYRYKVRAYATVGGKTAKGAFGSAKKIRAKPAKASVSSVTAKSKALTLKWKKVSGATGYQIAYRQKGSSKWYYKTVKSTSGTLSSLKKGKNYCVKVRAYTSYKGTKYYGAWSSVKTKKTK